MSVFDYRTTKDGKVFLGLIARAAHLLKSEVEARA